MERIFKRGLKLFAILSLIILFVPFKVGNGIEKDAKAADEIVMKEGDVIEGFAELDSTRASSDSAIAWVDDRGNLNAMKEGETKILVNDDSYTVKVEKYTDGSDVVGQLKILARYNDSMQFYDGHVYLLFTSYKDGVKIKVDDLYAGYRISGLYYNDIRNDISNGSNHTSIDADKYFTLDKSMKEVTLNRGDIVTIGMYRDFDLSVPDVALDLIKNSSLWTEIVKTGKTSAVKTIFKYLKDGTISADEGFARLITELSENGINVNELFDGYASGGVCFNRELYNQKLEWDQYENVTYELDITENQLERMVETLNGNLNRFSLLDNSCATVAVNAWNAAFGTRDGNDTAYKLESRGEGIFSMMDAPKGVRDSITKRLPGYYKNNSEMVNEPNAGYEDDTGWVYVSAPEKLEFDDSDDSVYLNIEKYNMNDSDADVKAYIKEDGNNRYLSEKEKIEPGTKVYVKPEISSDDYSTVLDRLYLNGSSFLYDSYYDNDEEAYLFTMPNKTSWLNVTFCDGKVGANNNHNKIQVSTQSRIDANYYAYLKTDEKRSYHLKWSIISQSEEGVVSYRDSSNTSLMADKPGTAVAWAYTPGNENVGLLFNIEIFDINEEREYITYNASDEYTLKATSEDSEEIVIDHSGYYVKKGSVITITPKESENKVISSIKVNDEDIACDEEIIADNDLDINVSLAKASIKNMPSNVKLENKGDTYEFNASVSYDDLKDKLLPIYDESIRYESSDPIVSIDEDGVMEVTGDVGEEGKKVTVTAYAGSSNNSVSATCKVIIGNYSGENVVGRLTVYARPIVESQLVAHGAVAFTAYEDTDFNISYYNYYKPTDKYYELMQEFQDDQDKYSTDPALFSEDIPIENRASYFEEIHNGAGSNPAPVSVKKGQTITMSNYGYESTNLDTVIKVFETENLSSNESVKTLIDEVNKYRETEKVDGEKAFDSLVDALRYIYQETRKTGHNPADGKTEGGLDVNREIYNQFRRNDSQMPNNYYTIEITQDELDSLKEYLSNPDNNYYSIFNKNCATGSRDIWNTATSDRPELKISANLTGLAADPESLNLAIGRLASKVTGTDKAGKNFYPRTPILRVRPEINISAKDLTYNGDDKELLGEAKTNSGTLVFALGDDDENVPEDSMFEEDIPKAVNAGDYHVWYKVIGDFDTLDSKPEEITVTIKKAYTTEIPNLFKIKTTPASSETDEDGIIDGLNPEKLYEYTTDNETWISVEEGATSIMVPAGTYRLRLQGDDNHYPSLSIRLKVGVLEPSEESPEPVKPSADVTESENPVSDSPSPDDNTPSPEASPSEVPLPAVSTPPAVETVTPAAVVKANMYKGLKVTQSGKKLTIKWEKVSKATGYVVYAAYNTKKFKKVKTIKKNSTLKATIKKLNGKTLDNKKIFKVYVAAINNANGKDTVIAKSVTAFVAGAKNKSFTNPKKLKLKKKNFSISKGKTKNIKADITYAIKKKKALKSSVVAKLRYVSSDTKIAKVNKKGKITALKKGSCKIYVYTANGLYKAVNVTVK